MMDDESDLYKSQMVLLRTALQSKGVEKSIVLGQGSSIKELVPINRSKRRSFEGSAVRAGFKDKKIVLK